MKRVWNSKLLAHFDWPLLGCVGAILFLGLLNLFSATFNLPVARYFHLQLIWIAVGLLFALLVTFFDYRILERLAYPLYVLVILLLIVVMVKGRTVMLLAVAEVEVPFASFLAVAGLRVGPNLLTHQLLYTMHQEPTPLLSTQD